MNVLTNMPVRNSDLTFSVWPFRDASMDCERVSEMLMAPSVDPAAMKLPGSFNASAYTLPLCPSQGLASYKPDCKPFSKYEVVPKGNAGGSVLHA